MPMDYKTLNVDSISSLPLKVKEAFPEEQIKKWESLNKGIVKIWEEQSGNKYIILNGTRYRVSPL